MKFSIDFDGTMWQHMDFFREFMIAMQARGHQVGCLTGHNAPDMEQPDINLMVARGFPKPDFWLGRTPEYIPYNGAKFKSDMIKQYNIDIHFDDYDYDNPETKAIFESDRSVLEKIFKVQCREPHNVHYE